MEYSQMSREIEILRNKINYLDEEVRRVRTLLHELTDASIDAQEYWLWDKLNSQYHHYLEQV